MKYKTVVLLIASSYILSLMGLLTITVFTDKNTNIQWKNGEIVGGEILIREYKTKYISQEDIKYNSYILGGSKAGFLNPKTFEKFSERKYYNFFTSIGIFGNYEPYCIYLVKHHQNKVNEIVLHLSTYETEDYTDKIYTPISMQPSFFGAIKSQCMVFKEKYLNISYFIALKKYQRTGLLAVTKDGQLNIDRNMISFFLKVGENYVNRYVLNALDKGLYKLFNEQTKLQYCNENIQALRRMKEICDSNNVKLTVIIGAHFISKFGEIYGEDFYDYLRNLISVNGSIWNFSGINDINMNPYNFYNEGHFWDFTGDKMIEVMYSDIPNTTDMDAFGILLTSENIDEYILCQKQKWKKLKKEYEMTNTIKLYEKDDSSYLGK